MRKGIIRGIILFFMAIVLSSCNKNVEGTQEVESLQTHEPAPESTYLEAEHIENEECQAAYTTFLDNLYENKNVDEELEFYVKDLDCNSIPELILKKNGVALTVYKYEGDVIKIGQHDFESGTSRFLFFDDSAYPGIFYFCVGGGYEWYSYITIEDNELVIEELWNKDFSGISKELGKKRGEIEEISNNKKLIKSSKKAYKRNNDLPFKKLTPSNYSGNLMKNNEDDLGDCNEIINQAEESYDNPIDAYFLPIINSKDISQAEIRTAQDTYRAVWASEFKNLMKWMRKKCVYQEDKKQIRAMDKRVKRNIELSKEVIATELLDIYEISPDSNKNKDSDTRSWYWGNGTRSRINQIQGEMYRDAIMRILELHNDAKDGGYEFRDIDYSKVCSEGGDTFYYIE